VFGSTSSLDSDNKDSYFWGDSLLVTPVVAPGVKSVEVELPEGVWFDFFSGQRYQGGQKISQPTDIETLPVLVKAGAFIPMAEATQSSDNFSSKQLSLHHYADSSVNHATGQMFEDNGREVGSIEKGTYRLFHFEAKRTASTYTIAIGSTGQGYQSEPKQRQLSLIVHHQSQRPKKVLVDGQSSKFDYNASTKLLTIALMLPTDGVAVEIKNQ